jgi:NAD+ synthase
MIVAGTGNLSESMMGYFTKWGDGAYDFNPIADLTATEVVEFGRFFGVPEPILAKPPSAGLYEGQTDEAEMGVTYKVIDRFLRGGGVDSPEDARKIEGMIERSKHKRAMPRMYGVNAVPGSEVVQ